MYYSSWRPRCWVLFTLLVCSAMATKIAKHQHKQRGNTGVKPKLPVGVLSKNATDLTSLKSNQVVGENTISLGKSSTNSLLQESLPESQVEGSDIMGNSLLQEAARPVLPSPTPTSSLMFNLGNETVNTNLQSALNVLAPEAGSSSSGSVGKHRKTGTPRGSADGKNTTKGKNGDVILEVIEMDPYAQTSSRLDIRFIAITSLYVLTGLVSVVATYCLAKAIISRRKRQKQYMLLTKSDMEFHRGGGGI